jgi:hypothetical protein
VALDLEDVAPLEVAGLRPYAQRWRAAAHSATNLNFAHVL